MLLGLFGFMFAQGVTYQTGKASYYGKDFHGKKTASGEIYNMTALTAAHMTLPFGTQVKVTHIKNKQSVVVTINDRGPYAKGRIIDLSWAAAQKIGLLKDGVTQVTLELVGDIPKQQDSVTQDLVNVQVDLFKVQSIKQKKSGYTIQSGTFDSMERAMELADNLRQSGIPDVYFQTIQKNGEEWVRVLSGIYPTRKAAEQGLKKVKSIVPDAFVIVLKPT